MPLDGYFLEKTDDAYQMLLFYVEPCGMHKFLIRRERCISTSKAQNLQKKGNSRGSLSEGRVKK